MDPVSDLYPTDSSQHQRPPHVKKFQAAETRLHMTTQPPPPGDESDNNYNSDNNDNQTSWDRDNRPIHERHEGHWAGDGPMDGEEVGHSRYQSEEESLGGSPNECEGLNGYQPENEDRSACSGTDECHPQSARSRQVILPLLFTHPALTISTRCWLMKRMRVMQALTRTMGAGLVLALMNAIHNLHKTDRCLCHDFLYTCINIIY